MKLTLLILAFIGFTSVHSRRAEKTCMTPVETADLDCDDTVRMWAFNTTSQQCERFELRACKLGFEVLNLYDTKHDCMVQCDKSNPLLTVEAPPTDICFLPTTQGITQCFAAFDKWTFDASAREGPRCVKTVYGGCAGTENLFENEIECTAACANAVTKIQEQCPAREEITFCNKYCAGDRDCDTGEVCCPSHDSKCGAQCVPTAKTSRKAEEENECSTPVDTKDPNCDWKVRMWAFNAKSQQCERFELHGCQLSIEATNLYNTKHDCMSRCDKSNPLLNVEAPATDICFLPTTKGILQCLAAYDMWTFDASAPEGPRCVETVYSGCYGTENLFENQTQCTAACATAVTKIQEQCPAREEITSCDKFCSGDRDCNEGEVCCPSQCGAQCVPIVKSSRTAEDEKMCSTPEDIKDPDCEYKIRMWAFNTRSQQCERFELHGCQLGIDLPNLYDTKQDCMSRCDKSNPLLKKEAPSTDICFLPTTKGIIQCLAYIPRWTFDASAPEGPRCVKTVFGGCSGTENLFVNETECTAACGDAVTKIQEQCPARELITSCDKFCFGDRDCNEGEVCCPSHNSTCRAQCIPAVPAAIVSFAGYSARSVTTNKRTARIEKKRAICEQPIQKGNCSEAVKKFAFNMDKNRCEAFLYGGCEGNDNNFDTASACQKTCGGDIPNEDLTCASVKCETKTFRQYRDRNCIPQYAKGACCPTSYRCEDNSEVASAMSEPQVCLYKGRSYAVGESIPAITEDDPCLTCKCSSKRAPHPPSISCVTEDCSDLDDSSEDCTEFNVPGQCCPTLKCDKKPLATCKANGRTYEEGDIFSTASCRSCVCTANYTDENGYGCSDQFCSRQPPSPNCVSVYLSGHCCPQSFRCPAYEPAIIPESRPKPDTSKGATNRTFDKSNCLLRPRIGKCRVSVLSYYYDAATQECKKFVFGGCDGNSNRFRSIEECEELCSGVTLPGITTKSLDNEDVCKLPKEVGPCQSFIPSYYYDNAKDSCEPFLYGGCKGNGNRFGTLMECQKQCLKPAEPKPNPELCNLPKNQGKCRASAWTYFFNSTSQRCESFIYGGCGGNDNNFATISQCTSTCKPTVHVEYKIPDYCSLPGEHGPCKGKQRRLYYDSLTGKCQEFTYGGCEGNLNRFFSEEECEYTCKPEVAFADSLIKPNATTVIAQDSNISTAKAYCALPPDQGFCLAFRKRFYYDPKTSSCKQFVYGGCKGNANNFRTVEQCMDSCGKQSNATVVLPEESFCRYGNMTFKIGDRVPSENICRDCICLTPPDITCSVIDCV